jgi:hypothetical protein
MAAFMSDLGEKNEYRPHFRKGALAALSYLMRINHLPCWFDFKHLYPNLGNVLSVCSYLMLLCVFLIINVNF